MKKAALLSSQEHRAVCTATPNSADAPADAHRAIGFLGSGVGKARHLLVEQKKSCSILSLIFEKYLYRWVSNPSASLWPWAACEHQWEPLVLPQTQGPSKAVGAECWVCFLGKFVAVFWGSEKGQLGCSQSVRDASLDLDFSAAETRLWGFCVLSLCSYPDHPAVPDLKFESLSMTALIYLAMH